MRALIDTSFLLVLVNPLDKNYRRARATMDTVSLPRLIAAPVLPELFYLVADRIAYRRAVQVYDQLRGPGFHIEALTADDMRRMSEIMHTYEDARFDYVDAAIMALSERLDVTIVCTFDRRDFPVFRPQHCPALDLLP